MTEHADPPPFETLAVSVDGRRGRLQLDQPDRLNPLGSTALAELAAAARWLDQTDAAVVEVTGAGRAFCAGFDRRELAGEVDPPAGAGGEILSAAELGAQMAAAISSMRAVTVAAVQGPCVGGGFVLALCCDLRVAANDAWFSLPETELGIPLAWGGVPRLVRELGTARATDLILSCRRVDAAEAERMGLVNEVVAPLGLSAALDQRVGVLLERSDLVLRATKQQVRQAAEALVPTDGPWAGTDHLLGAVRSLRG